MKKTIFLLSFILCIMYVQAGPYYTGCNQLNNLLSAVDGNAAGTPITDSQYQENKNWEKISGFCWNASGVSGDLGDADKVYLSYFSKNDYYAIRVIDWSGKNYIQKTATSINMQQYNLGGTVNTANAQDGELRWLRSINLSGNNFYSFTFDANNQVREEPSLVINLSNNIGSDGNTTWQSVTVGNFITPSQVTVNISNNNLSFAKIAGLTSNIQSGINVVYAPQTINKLAIFPNIDLSNELYSSSTACKFYFGNTELLSGTDYTDNGNGTFSFASTYLNQTISCRMTDPAFPLFDYTTNILAYNIILPGNPDELGSVDITPTTIVAFVGETVALTAAPKNNALGAAENTTVSWECIPSGAGSFDDPTSLTPKFTSSASGAVELKCTATQNAIVKTNSVTFTPTVLNTLELTTTIYPIYYQGEAIAVTVKANGSEVTRASFLNSLVFTTDATPTNEVQIVDNKLVYNPSAAGTISFGVRLGSVSATPKALKIAHGEISKSGMTVIDCSEPSSNFTGDKVIDGSEASNSRWASKGHLTLGGEYVTIDLGAIYNLDMLQISWETASAKIYDIYTGKTENSLARLTGQTGVSQGPVKTRDDCFSTEARYIKIVCLERASSHEYSIYEIYAYGTKVNLIGNPDELSSVTITPATIDAFAGETIALTASPQNFEYSPVANTTVSWECIPSGAGSFDNSTSLTPQFTPSIATSIELKCTATQGSIVEFNSVTFTPVVLTQLELTTVHPVYYQTETAAVTVKANGSVVTRANFLNSLTLDTDMAIQGGKLVYIPSTTGAQSISVSLGSISSTPKSLKVIGNNPVTAAGVTASSEKLVSEGGSQPATWAIDGNHGTRWAASQHGAEGITLNGSNKGINEYLIIDLGAQHKIDMVEVDWEGSRAKEYNIYVSNSADGPWTTAIGGETNVNGGGDHYIYRTVADMTTGQYVKIDCIERTNDSWNYSIFEITAYGVLADATGANNLFKSSGVYYSNNELNISVEGAISTAVYSVSGQKVLESNAPVINVSSIAAGCYIAKVSNENGTVSTCKFVK